jgi:hypothetical protein
VDQDLQGLIAIVLCLVLLVIGAIVALFAHLNNRSSSERRSAIHADSNDLQADYENALASATKGFGRKDDKSELGGILICQQCGRVNPRSAARCSACGASMQK